MYYTAGVRYQHAQRTQLVYRNNMHITQPDMCPVTSNPLIPTLTIVALSGRFSTLSMCKTNGSLLPGRLGAGAGGGGVGSAAGVTVFLMLKKGNHSLTNKSIQTLRYKAMHLNIEVHVHCLLHGVSMSCAF